MSSAQSSLKSFRILHSVHSEGYFSMGDLQTPKTHVLHATHSTCKPILSQWLRPPSILKPWQKRRSQFCPFSFSLSLIIAPSSSFSTSNLPVSFICQLQSPLFVKLTQLCLTLCDPMDYTVHGILQAGILEWVACPFSRGSSQPRDQNPGLVHCREILFLFSFNWRLITLQYCSGFCHYMHQPWVYICFPSLTPSHLPPHPIPQGHPSAPALSTLSHASNLDRRSVSHKIIYMFQCYSLKSSHPCLPPQSPKDCSLYLCLCYLSYRIIVAIFLNSIYMC